MAFKTADFDSTILPYKILHDDDVSTAGGTTATIRTDMTNGESGTLFSIDINNNSGNPAYFKMTFTTEAPVVGTTDADLVLNIPASTAVMYTMPEGISFTNLCMWAVTSGAKTGTSPVPNSQAKVLVTLITS